MYHTIHFLLVEGSAFEQYLQQSKDLFHGQCNLIILSKTVLPLRGFVNKFIFSFIVCQISPYIFDVSLNGSGADVEFIGQILFTYPFAQGQPAKDSQDSLNAFFTIFHFPTFLSKKTSYSLIITNWLDTECLTSKIFSEYKDFPNEIKILLDLAQSALPFGFLTLCTCQSAGLAVFLFSTCRIRSFPNSFR